MSRIAENAVIQDGIWYNPGEEIPDLGNWVRVHHDGWNELASAAE